MADEIDIEPMKVITIHLPVHWLDLIEKFIEEGRVPNRSEFIRYCIYQEVHHFFKEELQINFWRKKAKLRAGQDPGETFY